MVVPAFFVEGKAGKVFIADLLSGCFSYLKFEKIDGDGPDEGWMPYYVKGKKAREHPTRLLCSSSCGRKCGIGCLRARLEFED